MPVRIRTIDLPDIFRLAMLILCVFAWPHPAIAEPADIAAAARGVVRVVLVSDQSQDLSLVGHGSGFAIGPDLIVTNAHVVAPAREMEGIRIGIVPPEGETGWFAKIVTISPGNDLALLRLVEKGSLPALTLFTGPVEDGAEVHAVGYPGNVDLAQGLNIGDLVSPIPPVKTRGNVSAGRSSKQFETILHNAAIGSGNSGGPLLDACGRVIGVNTFGTLSDGSDSEFYFAVSMREIMRFLRAANVSAPSTGIACRSMADAERAEAERLAGQRAAGEEEARSEQEQRRERESKVRRDALFEILTERDNGLALAGLALVLALGAGSAAFALSVRDRSRDARIAGGAAVILVIGAALAWFTRPGFGDLDSRASALADTATTDGPARGGKELSGKLTCTVELDRSRVTVSQPADLSLEWDKGGCADGRTQFALSGESWTRIGADAGSDAITIARFDPADGSYVAERYLPDLAAMDKLRDGLGKLDAPGCGADSGAARAFGERQQAVAGLLPSSPNERLVYRCARSGD